MTVALFPKELSSFLPLPPLLLLPLPTFSLTLALPSFLLPFSLLPTIHFNSNNQMNLKASKLNKLKKVKKTVLLKRNKKLLSIKLSSPFLSSSSSFLSSLVGSGKKMEDQKPKITPFQSNNCLCFLQSFSVNHLRSQ